MKVIVLQSNFQSSDEISQSYPAHFGRVIIKPIIAKLGGNRSERMLPIKKLQKKIFRSFELHPDKTNKHKIV